MEQAFADRPPPTLPEVRADADVALVLASLPSMDDICVAAIATRETLGEGLLPLAEREFLRCIAAVLEHNCEDAWDDPDGATDTPQRRLWTQLCMFAKTCLTALPGGRAKQRRNRNILANRLERWGLGERRSLWDEAVKAAANSSARPPSTIEEEVRRRQRAALDLARRGLPGKAVQRLSGARLAAATLEVEAAMRAKFPEPPACCSSFMRAY